MKKLFEIGMIGILLIQGIDLWATNFSDLLNKSSSELRPAEVLKKQLKELPLEIARLFSKYTLLSARTSKEKWANNFNKEVDSVCLKYSSAEQEKLLSQLEGISLTLERCKQANQGNECFVIATLYALDGEV